MANLTKTLKVYNDGSYAVEYPDTQPPVNQLPEPVPFPGSKIIDSNENGHWARIKHDDPAPRIENSNNNEIQVFRRLREDGTKIDPRTKISVKIGETALTSVWRFILSNFYRAFGVVNDEPLPIKWENYCISLMTPWAWSRFIAKGYWRYDTGYPTQYQLGCGGNDVHVLDITSDNWARIEYMDYNAGPDYSINPYEHRWLFSKQWLVGGVHGDPHWVVDKGYVGGVGDVNIGNISPVDMYVSTWVPDDDSRPGQQGLEFWPDLPLEGELDGVPCTITKYGLYKTDTYGYVENKGWYVLEEMIPSGDPNDYAIGGTWRDRVVHFSPWLKEHPPTYIGWTRSK